MKITFALTISLIIAVQTFAGNIENSIEDVNDSIIFKQGMNELMRVQGDGKVGIGTASPTANLHLYGSEDNGSQYLLLEQSTRSGSLFLLGEKGYAPYTNYQGFNMYSNGFINLRSDLSTGVRIFLNGQSNNGYQHAKFKSSGTLMLGTYDEVASITVGNRNGTLVGPSTASGGAGNYKGGGLRLQGGASSGNAAGGAVTIWTSTAGASGDTLNPQTEKVRIDSEGNVGIATTTAKSKLAVNGLPSGTTSSVVTGDSSGLAGAVCITLEGNMYIDTDGSCAD